MSKIAKKAALCTGLVIAMSAVPVITAKNAPVFASAPIPIQLTTAKKVFISYRESDADPGVPDLTYNEFYGLMKDWGKYELTATPTDADLVFEIRYISGISDSQICLSIVDAKTHFVLWPFIQHVQNSSRETSRRKNFDAAMSDLIDAVKRVSAPPSK
jgi:hypothetical protein